MQATSNEFSLLKQEFDQVNNVATEQKSQTDAINLIDDIFNEDNPFNNISTKDIWIEDDLFDNDDTQTIKNASKEIIDVAKPDRTVFDDINFKINEPAETITTSDDIETINIEDDIDIPSDGGIATDAPKKVKIITTNSNQLRLASNRIKKKYLRQKSWGTLKQTNKKAAYWLRKAGFLGADDLETIDYNNDANINDLDDVETVNYNNGTNVSKLDNVNLNKTSGTQIAAKNIVKKYRNLARKKP